MNQNRSVGSDKHVGGFYYLVIKDERKVETKVNSEEETADRGIRKESELAASFWADPVCKNNVQPTIQHWERNLGLLGKIKGSVDC